MNTLAIATGNPHKLKELKELLIPFQWEVRSPRDLGVLDFEPEETGLTFSENAIIKSNALYSMTGLPCLADDSGLVVTALNGDPGIYSARFGGEDLTDKDRALLVLDRMKGLDDRSASFHCVLSFTTDKGVKTFYGVLDGMIGEDYVDGNGFGYDPIFYYPPLSKYFSELTSDEKNSISHRSLALGKFIEYLKNV